MMFLRLTTTECGAAYVRVCYMGEESEKTAAVLSIRKQ